MGVCNCSMFCCTLLYVHSSIAIILMGKRELIALLNLSSWCPVMVERLFLSVPQGCLQFVIVVFPDHTHLLFLNAFLLSCVLCLVIIVIMEFPCNTYLFSYKDRKKDRLTGGNTDWQADRQIDRWINSSIFVGVWRGGGGCGYGVDGWKVHLGKQKGR